ncbi:nucleobase transporter 1/2 [Haloferula luteola]|uniref:Nucleobase transporter 1/2 n=1 Tax=Haloferula luteola TaxID=595692 RepID=A0A840V257_9BACT|nr:solute carrier family 23 protein [Haloferula luteola]MBB5351513.1 nucleobase transporter 1/2 [Haloferula luteola]
MSSQPPQLTYGIEDKPPLRESIPLGFQHYLTMFGSTVAIPFILADALGASPGQVGQLIGTIFFVSGIATLLQTTFGNRLPIIQGGTFSFLAPTIAICSMAGLAEAGFEVRMQHVQGAVIAGSIFEILLGFTGAVGLLLRFVSPVVIAPTIALIGLALFQFGATRSGAGAFWPIGGLAIGLIIAFSQYLRKVHRAFSMYPVLLGIVGAWAACILGTEVGWFGPGHPAFTDFSKVSDAPWLRVPYPFQWGPPHFTITAIVGMLAGYIASVIESVGDYYACARLSGAPIPTARQVNRGIGFEGIGCFIAGIFGSGNGTTSYSENIGAIGLTKVGSRRVVQCGAGFMLILAVFGKFGALFSTIPQPIVGGMYCVMFGMIASVGLSNLQFVDLNSARNLFIIGFSLFMGLSLPEYFRALEHPLLDGRAKWLGDILTSIGLSGMSVGAIMALILDNTIPGTAEERGLIAWQGKP